MNTSTFFSFIYYNADMCRVGAASAVGDWDEEQPARLSRSTPAIAGNK